MFKWSHHFSEKALFDSVMWFINGQFYKIVYYYENLAFKLPESDIGLEWLQTVLVIWFQCFIVATSLSGGSTFTSARLFKAQFKVRFWFYLFIFKFLKFTLVKRNISMLVTKHILADCDCETDVNSFGWTITEHHSASKTSLLMSLINLNIIINIH